MIKLKMIFVDHRFRLHQTQKITIFFFQKIFYTQTNGALIAIEPCCSGFSNLDS